MILRIVKMHFSENQVTNFQSLFSERKSKIVGNDGCKWVKLLQDVEDPCTFFTYSCWESTDHLNAYRHSEYFKETWQLTKAMMDQKAKAWSTKMRDDAQSA